MIAAKTASSSMFATPPPCGRALAEGNNGRAISHSPTGTIQSQRPHPVGAIYSNWSCRTPSEHTAGGGIYNIGKLTVKGQAAVTGNTVAIGPGAKYPLEKNEGGKGGGIFNHSTATVAPGSIKDSKPTQCDGPKSVENCTY
ncbi:hypothetical protein [Streptomyces sp. NPDC001876]|uniref:hypothetical protein n=1 Tax=Streptomyces sp. NPDC001876 TaxID=3154402 RepID=UPI003321F203